MVLPIAIAGGVAANVAVEVAYQKYRGRKASQQQMVTAGALGAVPGLGMVKSLRKGGPIIRQMGDIPFFRSRGLGTQVGPYSQEAYALYLVGNKEARRIVTGTLRGLTLNRAIDYAYKPVESSVRSLTSSTQKAGTTTRVPGAKRYTVKKKSRRTAFSGNARRRTTYCKTHKQYDFCQKYNIRK